MVQSIVKFEEKHGDIYYDASTPELLNKAFLKVLRGRDGYYYQKPSDTPYIAAETLAKAEVEESVLEGLPESIRNEILQAKKYVKSVQRRHKQDIAWWNLYRETMDAPTDEEALAKTHSWTQTYSSGKDVTHTVPMVEFLIDYNSDSQYEGYKIIDLPEL